jgi:hypothetical protein
MATRNIKDAKDLNTGELIYFKGHAQATFTSDGSTVEDAISGASGSAGANQSASKLYLIGATAQTTNNIGVQTYSNSDVYMQSGKLYVDGSEVGTMASINNTVSALTASHTSLDGRVSILEDSGLGGSISAVFTTGVTYLIGTPSAEDNQTLSETNFSTSVYIASGNCYADSFCHNSDETLKTFGDDIEVDFNKLKKLPKKYFTWNDGRKGGMHLGTSAQKVRELYPEIVSGSDKGTLTVDYAKLSVVALKAIDKLHEENEILREMLTKMDERLSKLEDKK